jgi:hypothetical protein
MAEEYHATMPGIGAKGSEALERQEFASRSQRDFARLKEDPQIWQAELDERAELENSLDDGLDQ